MKTAYNIQMDLYSASQSQEGPSLIPVTEMETIPTLIESFDLDGDGNFESIAVREDRFDNAGLDLDQSADPYWVYDSYTIIRDGKIERGNRLAENCSFMISGPDKFITNEFGSIYFNSSTPYILNRTVITTEVIPQYDVEVMVDPRVGFSENHQILQDTLLTDPHGVIYWTDPDGSNRFNVGFIFTEKSFAENYSIGYYVKSEDNHYLHLGVDDYLSSGDYFFPSYWLSGVDGFEQIYGMAWYDALKDHEARMDSLHHGTPTMFSVSYQLDRVVNNVLMGVNVLMTAGLSFILPEPAASGISFAMYFGLNYLYQYYLREKYLIIG